MAGIFVYQPEYTPHAAPPISGPWGYPAPPPVPPGTAWEARAGGQVVPVYLHPLLRPGSPLVFDVTIDPSNAGKWEGGAYRGVDPNEIALPATKPRRKNMRIVVQGIPWTTYVRADSAVSVKDVLNAIYRMLHKPPTKDELDSARQIKHAVTTAFRRRCQKSPALPGFEEQKGVMRADWVLENTHFRGLHPSLTNPDEWYLLLGPP